MLYLLCIFLSPRGKKTKFSFSFRRRWQTQLQQPPLYFLLSQRAHRRCCSTPPSESKKWTLSHQLGRTLPLPDKIRTRSERKILTSLCIPVPALTFYFVRSSKDVSAASLIVSSFLLFAAFKKEDSGFDEVRKKLYILSLGSLWHYWPSFDFRNALVQPCICIFFLIQNIHQGLDIQMYPRLQGIRSSPPQSCCNPVHKMCHPFVYWACWVFPSHLDRRPSGVSLHPRSNAAWEVSQHTNQAVPACGWKSHSVPTFGNVSWCEMSKKKKKVGKICTIILFNCNWLIAPFLH